MNVSDDIVNEFLRRAGAHKRPHWGLPVPYVICRDGFKISVQAGQTLYCEPRQNQGPWRKVECGYPSDIDPDLMPWAESEDDPCLTVYAYVPVEAVAAVLEKHGGIDYDAIALGLLTQPKQNQ